MNYWLCDINIFSHVRIWVIIVGLFTADFLLVSVRKVQDASVQLKIELKLEKQVKL